MTEVYFPPKPISVLLNRLDKLFLCHVVGMPPILIGRCNRRQMRVTVRRNSALGDAAMNGVETAALPDLSLSIAHVIIVREVAR